MTPAHIKALERYVSATCYFMMHHPQGAREYLDAKAHLERTFGHKLPNEDVPALHTIRVMPDIL